MKKQKEALVDLLAEAFELGFCIENATDRELMSDWLMYHNVCIISADVE